MGWGRFRIAKQSASNQGLHLVSTYGYAFLHSWADQIDNHCLLKDYFGKQQQNQSEPNFYSSVACLVTCLRWQNTATKICIMFVSVLF